MVVPNSSNWAGVVKISKPVQKGIVSCISGKFDDLISLIAVTQALQAVLEASSYFAVRAKVPEAQLTPWHPIVPALVVGLNVALAVWVAADDWTHGKFLSLYGLGVIALAAVAYAIVRELE